MTGVGGPVKVLYIVGKGRSGSTLLDSVLGELDGFFAAGEVFYLWEMGLGRKYLCGCGRPVPECEVWSDVTARALRDTRGEAGTASLEEVRAWYRDVFRWRRMPRLLLDGPGRERRWDALEGYARVMSRVYQALRASTGARVIVDSSKWPTDPVLLGMVPGVDAYCLHLLRDPRAVTYSWKRRKALPDRRSTMPRYPSLYSGVSWLARNAIVEQVRRRLPPERYLRMRYEDFVAEPRTWLKGIATFVQEPPPDLPFLDGRSVRVGLNHTVAGNPSRFEVGERELREDDEWRRGLGAVDRATATLLALPLLGRYGYPMRTSTREPVGA